MNLGKTFSFARGKRSSSSYPDGTEGETSPDTGPASPRSSFSDMMASSRSSISGMMASRKSITDSALSFLAGDPDKAHDKKLSGLQIDASVTTAKGSLRKLRDEIDKTVTFYLKYAERKPGASSGHLPLVLPEMAEWSHHEVFCGSEKSAELLYHAAAQLAAIEALVNAERQTIGSVVGTLRDDARAICERGLEAIYTFELELRDVTMKKEAANKALRKGTAARTAAMSDEQKAEKIADVGKRNKASIAAQAALEKANSDIAEAEAALESSQSALTRLETEDQPSAVQAATAARQEVEVGPLSVAAAALAEVRRMTARGAVKVLGGDHVPTSYKPTAKRKAPKETNARFAAYVVQWTLAKRRGKTTAALLEEFGKSGLETLLAPSKESAVLEALMSECEQDDVIQRLRAVLIDDATHSTACSGCKTALDSLRNVLGDFRTIIKEQVAAADKYEKDDKALKTLIIKKDDLEKVVNRLQMQAEGGHPAGTKGAKEAEQAAATLEKKKADLEKLDKDVADRKVALGEAEANIEAFKADLEADGEGSVMRLVAKPLEECVRAYGDFCATRSNESFFWEGESSNASAAPAFTGGAVAAPAADISDNPFAAPATNATDNPFAATAPDASENPFASPEPAAAAGPFDAQPVDLLGSNEAAQPQVETASQNGEATAAQGSTSPQLPPGWTTAVDPASGRTYYVGPNREVSWTPPAATPPVATQPPAADGDNPFGDGGAPLVDLM